MHLPSGDRANVYLSTLMMSARHSSSLFLFERRLLDMGHRPLHEPLQRMNVHKARRRTLYVV